MKASVFTVFTGLVSFLVTPAFSCGKYPKETSGPAVEVRVPVDWSLSGEVPQGMTVLIYSSEGSLKASRVTADVSGAAFRLGAGTYRAGVISYSEEEWKSLSLRGLSDRHSASAFPTDAEPGPFACSCGAAFVIREGDLLTGGPITIPPLRPMELTSRLLVRIRADGIRHLRSVSGTLFSPCRVRLFEPACARDTEHNVRLPEEIWAADSLVSCTRRLLGPPDSLLDLRLRMEGKDGTVIDTLIPVRDRITSCADGTACLTLGAREGERFRFRGSSGGFDAEIGGWTPGEDTEIILHSFTHKNIQQ